MVVILFFFKKNFTSEKWKTADRIYLFGNRTRLDPQELKKTLREGAYQLGKKLKKDHPELF